MSKSTNDNKKKKFRMPYGQISLWSFLIMIVAFFFNPAISLIAFVIGNLFLGFAIGRMVAEDKSNIPIWWGGL